MFTIVLKKKSLFNKLLLYVPQHVHKGRKMFFFYYFCSTQLKLICRQNRTDRHEIFALFFYLIKKVKINERLMFIYFYEEGKVN